MKTLNEITSMLTAALGSEALVKVVNTRIALRTGIDLKRVSFEQNENPEAVGKVIEALTALGFTLESLRAVAIKRGSQ